MKKPEIKESEYDELMNEARKIFETRWTTYEDPYAFHKAFEFAERKLNRDEKKITKMLDALISAVNMFKSLKTGLNSEGYTGLAERVDLEIKCCQEALKKAGVTEIENKQD